MGVWTIHGRMGLRHSAHPMLFGTKAHYEDLKSASAKLGLHSKKPVTPASKKPPTTTKVKKERENAGFEWCKLGLGQYMACIIACNWIKRPTRDNLFSHAGV
uniref:Uncharacterized protein n=1 Tax=Oryza punctata TaxID=4537 RepID=A0A0E0M5V4_ORYPU